MSDLEFPTLSRLPDGEKFKLSSPNASKEGKDTDGGYWITRPRFTRRPPKSFKFSYTDISDDDKATLLDFWEDKAKGSSVAFNWTDPSTGLIHNVRFGKGVELEFDRTGYGPINRWDTNELTVTEV